MLPDRTRMDLAPDRRIDLQAQNQPSSGLQSIGSISIRSERTEKTACIRVVRSGISCGIDRRLRRSAHGWIVSKHSEAAVQEALKPRCRKMPVSHR